MLSRGKEHMTFYKSLDVNENIFRSVYIIDRRDQSYERKLQRQRSKLLQRHG
jgi:hypothetical protein